MPTNPPLRQLAGLPTQPTPLSQCALIMVDAQNTYVRGVMALEGVDRALEECGALLERARSGGVPVVHIQHDGGPGSPYDVSAPIGAIVERVKPRAGEPVIVKNYPNSFFKTDLDEILRGLGIKNLVIGGFMTHMCINSTARDAFNRGYAVTIPGSATATRALPAIDGGIVSAQSLQAASLAALADLFAIIVPRVADIPG